MTNKTLNLKTNCRKCSVILNEETWTLNRSASKGILSECKFCRRKSRKETPSYYDRKKSTYIKYCLRCNNKLLITSKSHNYCSFNCIFESSYSISPTGCWIWNIPLQKHPSMNFMKKRIFLLLLVSRE